MKSKVNEKSPDYQEGYRVGYHAGHMSSYMRYKRDIARLEKETGEKVVYKEVKSKQRVAYWVLRRYDWYCSNCGTKHDQAHSDFCCKCGFKMSQEARREDN